MAGTIDVALGLVQENALWLVSRRGPGRVFAGFWEFPGGKMLDGESAEEAVVREVRQETGLMVESVGRLGPLITTQPELSVTLHLILCRRVDGTASPCDGWVLEVRWVSCEELVDLPMPPANSEIIAKICPMSLDCFPCFG